MTEQGFGMAPYQGYEYQIQATVWVALTLMIEQLASNSLIVEPVSGEDVAVEVHKELDGKATHVGVTLDAFPLDIQIKRKTSEPWKAADFASILKGPTSSGTASRRVWPLQALRNNPDKQYILITDTSVAKTLKPFLVTNLTSRSQAKYLPSSIAKDYTIEEQLDFSARIGILEHKIPKLLDFEIKQMLEQTAHVPSDRAALCMKELFEQVRERLLGRRPSVWTKSNLEEVIRRFEGLPHKPKELFEFVEPASYPDMQEQLNTVGRLIVTGPAGVGKTMVADALEYEHRVMKPPFQVVTEKEGPTIINEYLKKSGRYLFHLHDPWGQNQLSTDAASWTAELPKLLMKADGDKRFLITTRMSIQQIADAARNFEFKSITIALLAEHYSLEARSHILQNYASRLLPWQKDFVHVHKQSILEVLRYPLSISFFVSRLAQQPEEQALTRTLSSLLSQSNIEAISQTVKQEVKGLNWSVIPSAVLAWILFIVYKNPTETQIKEFTKTIREQDRQLDLQVRKMFGWMVESGWFNHQSGAYTAHPLVIQGLELVVIEELDTADRVTEALLYGLHEHDLKLAFEIYRQIQHMVGSVPQQVLGAIISYLICSVIDSSDSRFAAALEDLGRWSSHSKHPVALLASGLLPPKNYNKYGYVTPSRWKKPQWTTDETASVAASKEAISLADRFIRLVLPEEVFTTYDVRLLEFFHSLGWDLAASFQQGLSIMQYPSAAKQLMLEGALAGHHTIFDKYLASSFDELDAANEWYQEEYLKDYHRASQAELDAAHITYILDQVEERFYPIENSIHTIVRLRRKVEGYQWIASHPRSQDLVKAWSEVVMEVGAEGVSSEELYSLLQLCRLHLRPYAWNVIGKCNCTALRQEVLQDLWSPLNMEIVECLHAVVKLYNPSEWQEATRVGNTLSWIHRANIATENWMVSSPYQQESQQFAWLLFSPIELSVLQMCFALGNDNSIEPLHSIHREQIDLIIQLVSYADERLGIRALAILVMNGHNVKGFTARFQQSELYEVRGQLIDVLFIMGTPEARLSIREFLRDPDYRCRRHALRLISENASIEEEILIWELANDPSAPVREALAYIISVQLWGEGPSILYQMLFDTRDVQEWSSLNPEYHVARAAAIALDGYEQLPEELLNRILHLLTPGNFEIADIVVRYHLMDAVSKFQRDEIVILFKKCLMDIQQMVGMNHQGFPLRYAAAWGIVTQIQDYDLVPDEELLQALTEGAIHSDARLAGPCLIVLGLAGEIAAPFVRCVMQEAHDHAVERMFLCYAASVSKLREEPPITMYPGLPHDYPGVRLLTWMLQQSNINQVVWKRFTSEYDILNWLQRMKEDTDVHAYIRLALHDLCEDTEITGLDIINIRNHELAENMSIMNSRTMSGIE